MWKSTASSYFENANKLVRCPVILDDEEIASHHPTSPANLPSFFSIVLLCRRARGRSDARLCFQRSTYGFSSFQMLISIRKQDEPTVYASGTSAHLLLLAKSTVFHHSFMLNLLSFHHLKETRQLFFRPIEPSVFTQSQSHTISLHSSSTFWTFQDTHHSPIFMAKLSLETYWICH